jgi:hypothetical protein
MVEWYTKTIEGKQSFSENLTVKVISENEYEVNVDFVWKGITKEDQN